MRLKTPAFVLLLLAGFHSAHAAERFSERLPARQGETCIVCNKPVGGGDIAYLARGQRAAVHMEDCEAVLLEEPGRHMAKMRPSSILFTSEAGAGIPGGWLLVGLWVLLGLFFGGLCAHRAVRLRRSPAACFLLGFFFSVPAYVYVCSRKPATDAARIPEGLRKVPATRDPAPCPACGHDNHPSARQCTSCGAALEPLAPSETSALRSS